MKYKLILSAAALSFAFGASALDVNVANPGTLAEALGDNDIATLTSLTVSGQLDASDLYYLGNNAKSLVTLDLSGARIMAYNGEKTINGMRNYPADLIPAGAFAGSRLTSVALPAGVTEIGSMAFATAPLAALPDLSGVKKIDDGAFAAIAATEITYPAAEMGANVFAGSEVRTVTVAPGTSIAAGAFDGCANLSEVSGAEGVVAIGDRAFSNTAALSEFNFGNGLKAIGSGAFRASGLVNADLSAATSLDTIGEFAFAQMPALELASIASPSVKCAPGVFFDDKQLATLNYPETLKNLADYLLKGTESLALSTFPESLQSIGNYAMTGNTATTTLHLPATLAYIGDGAMEGMTGLTEIDAAALSARPEIGADVWAGVDQPSVKLKVNEDLYSDFKSAEQWQNFDISYTSGIDDIVSDKAPAASLSARFAGTLLQIAATGVDIARVELFDISGATLVSLQANGTAAEVETATFANPYFIVTVTLEDGTRSSLKLKR